MNRKIMPELIELDESAATITIDGEEFPYYVDGDGPWYEHYDGHSIVNIPVLTRRLVVKEIEE